IAADLALQPDCTLAQHDWVGLERQGTGRGFHEACQRLERALRTARHRTGPHVIAGRVPRALKATPLYDTSLSQRREEVAAAVGYCERLAATQTDGERAMRRLDDGDLTFAEIVNAYK